MSTRQRMTWGGENVLPVERARAASAHPATPDEGSAHPAYQADPEASDYENGDTSSWAEDVHPGPYSNSAHPATPDEGAAHPAYKAAAMELRAAVEQKAEKCLRVASVLLGKSVSDRQVEKQALDLMDLPEVALESTLTRLASLNLFASEDEDEDGEEMASKKAEDDEDDDAEAKLASMLAEEGMGRAAFGEMAEVETMLAEMLKEEMEPSFMEEDDFSEPEPFSEREPEPLTMEDPMGMGDYGTMDDEEEMLLSQLFADHTASKKSDDDEDEGEGEGEDVDDSEEVEVEEVEMASKKASQRPRPKKASAGPARLGGVSKEAASDVKELEKLWESAPDISGAF